MKYVIAWRSKITGYEGQGTYQFDYDECLKQCKIANRGWPEIDHYPKAVDE